MRALVQVAAVAVLLAGCTGLGGGGETPKRPPLNVADQVQQVDRSKLIGTWQCRELNPYPEVPKQQTTITYGKDGTLSGVGQSEARPPFAAMTVKITGKWAVEGDQIVASDIKTEAGSADEFTNVMAGIGSSIVNTFSKSQPQGSGDVLELTQHKLVFRGVGVEDPPTYSCTR
jgi:hypothetical protein